MVQLVFTPEAAESKQAVTVMPKNIFLDTFADPHKMDEGLHEEALLLIDEWETVNGSDDTRGRRTNVEASFCLGRNEWRKGYARHFSEYELQINSWGFTATHNKVFHPPPPQLDDLKVFSPPSPPVETH
jgi:hypothetical protein